jgi:hypothetical protein
MSDFANDNAARAPLDPKARALLSALRCARSALTEANPLTQRSLLRAAGKYAAFDPNARARRGAVR